MDQMMDQTNVATKFIMLILSPQSIYACMRIIIQILIRDYKEAFMNNYLGEQQIRGAVE